MCKFLAFLTKSSVRKCVWIVPAKPNALRAQDVVKFCEGQIAHYKIPRHVRICESLPMTVTGKAQKFKMRDEMMRELGLRTAKTA